MNIHIKMDDIESNITSPPAALTQQVQPQIQTVQHGQYPWIPAEHTQFYNHSLHVLSVSGNLPAAEPQQPEYPQIREMEIALEHAEWYDETYESIVAVQSDLTSEVIYPSLMMAQEIRVTAVGTALNTEACGGIPPLPYSAEECVEGQPPDYVAEAWWTGYDDTEEWFASELPLSDQRPRPRIDPQESVGKLEEVDITMIAPEDMKCLHCWDDFEHTEVETVEL
ncbi:uncharacterized protein M421DRAFT_7728 [Didymella exigua CBS 183.55]|uniref:Uncharacterized protein n=1 Tax=Didymella exigua CBS 183.55 TaxID=1150837 RepID=A0A6A5RDG3_9PLEO|nr:uncharacterized protein M421DRAFT_7728 [Didymella exigua CBS 183.55]KAF1925712.1 hypothetical protein M421DRAFT_7728 [Didymella exigua CBS 183.55]